MYANNQLKFTTTKNIVMSFKPYTEKLRRKKLEFVRSRTWPGSKWNGSETLLPNVQFDKVLYNRGEEFNQIKVFKTEFSEIYYLYLKYNTWLVIICILPIALPTYMYVYKGRRTKTLEVRPLKNIFFASSLNHISYILSSSSRYVLF